ncbi:MAG: outer membrane protein assembly factor BamA [Dysgonamonadaceae bacterium]|jgi:outer membrane protein insertion porin family|nr:outer membrane protein assembly factor BamA [Dysgonamonadaceae bacterium]
MVRKFLLLCLSILWINGLFAGKIAAQAVTTPKDTTVSVVEDDGPYEEMPVINYSMTKSKYYVLDSIRVTGADNYEDFVLLGFAGLQKGMKVRIPGEELTDAAKRFWKHGLFSDVKIVVTRMYTDVDKVWIEIQLTARPTVSEIRFSGVKKGEREDLEAKIGMITQITPNLINRAKTVITKYFDEKGFSNADVNIMQKDDVNNKGKMILEINVDKHEKTKIHEITISGNEYLSDYDLKIAMKKTNEGFDLKKRFKLSWRKLFSTKKYVNEEYEADLKNIIQKYNEMGYRDARIVSDSVAQYDDKRVNIFITVEEGDRYFIRDVRWVGNTLYPSDFLTNVLNMKSGDVYNQKKLTERLQSDDDAVANLYYNTGYIFSGLDPVETYVENDSVDIEVRIQEGIQATINRVIISGNDRLYEDIIRRELMVKPGQLFSKDALMRSAREIAQMGHFDPENMDIKPIPDEETGTVDLSLGLTSKANDQVEFSAGWGQTGVIGRLSLKFTNFSLKNLLHPNTYKGVIPQGEGQTLTLSGQTNGRYYQSYSISFMDPWFGGKRPNSLSVGAYYMIQTGVDSRYYNNYYNNPYYYGGYGYGYGYGSGYDSGYGYGSGSMAYDENQSMKIFGFSVGYGKRLTWPDNYFQAMAELSYQRYMLKNWDYFLISNGDCNNIALNLTLSRNSIDNPLYTRMGSQFTASVGLTPPYSLWDGKDYASMDNTDGAKYNWIEYHKWKFKGKIFMPLANPEKVKRTPVLMSRMEYGFVGSYNPNKRSPFETFYMGGDGMTGYYSTYAQETVGLRGYENGSLTPRGSEGYAYSRMAFEFRYPFLLEPTSTIYGLAFVEAGNAWTDIKSFSPFELKRSAGFGVRIFLPMIGMMGIDWGYGFDRAMPYDNISGGHFHFILGQEF